MMFFKKKYALGLLMFAGSTIFVSGVYLTFFWMKGGIGDYNIAGGATLELSWYLETNDRTEGRITVGGGNEEIKFYVKDPYGVVIYDAGVVKTRVDTGFTAANSGIYRFYFENQENSSEKIVKVRFRSPYEPRLTIFDIIGLSIMFVGFAISTYGVRGLWIITHTH
ncbi:MAG: emp24/gp25L/p24 family protein [Candidatus Bathyarchaeota archaeon]|nr:emp24/gp25L/p24 family protein [Candidatus Bathyarchaeota archaeon]